MQPRRQSPPNHRSHLLSLKGFNEASATAVFPTHQPVTHPRQSCQTSVETVLHNGPSVSKALFTVYLFPEQLPSPLLHLEYQTHMITLASPSQARIPFKRPWMRKHAPMDRLTKMLPIRRLQLPLDHHPRPLSRVVSSSVYECVQSHENPEDRPRSAIGSWMEGPQVLHTLVVKEEITFMVCSCKLLKAPVV